MRPPDLRWNVMMRWLESIPRNPWPHDMTITVEDRPSALLELLWLREAYGLHPGGDDLPPLLIQTPEPAEQAVDDATRREWEGSWARLWHEVAAHAGREVDPRLLEQLRGTALGGAERRALLRELVGPTWDDEFGRDALEDPSYRRWEQDGMAEFIASRPHAHDSSPERRDLEALIPAWRAGLTKIVVIPCHGEHTRTLGPNALLVTEGTHADSDAYRRALASFST
jgi:hypothetical protein